MRLGSADIPKVLGVRQQWAGGCRWILIWSCLCRHGADFGAAERPDGNAYTRLQCGTAIEGHLTYSKKR